jgi:hypothetical protein
MVCIVSLHAWLISHYWAWDVLFYAMFHWFIITWHGLYCFTSCFTGLSSLGMVCIVWIRAALFRHYWVWFVLFHFAHWFIIIIIKHDLYLSFHSLLFYHHWPWFQLLHFMLQWFILTGQCLYFFASLTGSSLLGMVVLFHFPHWLIIIKHDIYLPFQDSLVHHHWAWFVLFDYTLHWFFLTGRGSYCFISWVTGSLLLGRDLLRIPHWFIII